MTDPGHDPVGSVGDEAAKLFGALAGWANDHMGDRAREIDEHLATGSAECLYCPVCRTVHAVRQASPEVRAHLVTAASSLLQAAAGALATAVPADAGGRTGSVEHIDLDPDDSPDSSPEAPR